MNTRMWANRTWLWMLPAAVTPVLMGAACAWLDVRNQQWLCATYPDSATLWNSYGGTTLFPACTDSFIGSAAWFWTYVLLCLAVATVLFSVVFRLVTGWHRTGSRPPHGYVGLQTAGLGARLGELAVFMVFGPVTVVGTYLVMVGSLGGSEGVTLPLASITAGLNAAALLMVNNLRDIPTDRDHGRRTYAVRVGYAAARRTLVAVVLISVILSIWGFSDKVLYACGTRIDWLPLTALLGIILAASTIPLVVALHRDDLRRALPAASLFALVTAACWAAACFSQGAYVTSLLSQLLPLS